MADAETEAEWEKSRRIDEERMKAARAINEAKPDAESLSHLDPSIGKPRGWTTDRAVVMASAEKLASWAGILAPAGVVLGIIGDVGAIVGSVGKLGMATALLSGIPGGLGVICLWLAIFFGMIGSITAIYYHVKQGRKLGFVGWSSMVSVVLAITYMFVRNWLLTMM